MTLFYTLAEATNPTTAANDYQAILNAQAAPQATGSNQYTTEADKHQCYRDQYFNNLDEIFKELKKIGTPELKFPAFIAMRERMLTQEGNIKRIFNAMTIPQLKEYVFTYGSSYKKAELVKKGYDGIISYFTIDKSVSYSPFSGETYEAALDKVLKSITEAEYYAYTTRQEEKRAALNKALANPETLEEFRTFIERKGIAALTTEQKARYDELFTDSKRDQRSREEARNATVKAVEVSEGLEMEIKKSHHAKKNIPLWVVVLSSRVDSSQFAELKDRAQKLGGYYSSYRGQGAIPGFTFENEEAANLFTQVKNGNVDASELREQQQTDRQQDRAETLEEKAANIEEAATDSLNTERKDNTHRRAQFAASAERQAMAQLELSQTLQQIAVRMKEGTIKYLDRLQNITELETLMQILTAAKWKHINTKNINVNVQEYEYSDETAEFVTYPFPHIWKANILQDLRKVANEKGKIMAANRMLKRINGMKPDQEHGYITTAQGIEDFETLFCSYSKGLDRYTRESYSKELMRYKRVQRLRLESAPELRAAIRELINIMNGVEVSPEVKRMQQIRDLERKFIGRDIPGFFPTPAMLAAEVVDKAGIEEGDEVCEPNGGLGHIAQVIRDQHPGAILTCVEYNSSLAEALQQKGFNAIHGDFLEHIGSYDKIVMNPPFENGQDIDHVQHAWTLLKPGGRLVAIMAANKLKTDRKTLDFVGFVECNGGVMEPNPAGAFLSSFRPTGVNTITLILNK